MHATVYILATRIYTQRSVHRINAPPRTRMQRRSSASPPPGNNSKSLVINLSPLPSFARPPLARGEPFCLLHLPAFPVFLPSFWFLLRLLPFPFFLLSRICETDYRAHFFPPQWWIVIAIEDGRILFFFFKWILITRWQCDGYIKERIYLSRCGQFYDNKKGKINEIKNIIILYYKIPRLFVSYFYSFVYFQIRKIQFSPF